jgi:hypothetical protein
MTKLAPMAERIPSQTSNSRPKSGSGSAWQERRELFRTRLPQPSPGGISGEEVEAHFSGMPEHYWEQVNESDLLWGLATVHGFLQLMATPNVPATKPYVEWRGTGEGCWRKRRPRSAPWE